MGGKTVFKVKNHDLYSSFGVGAGAKIFEKYKVRSQSVFVSDCVRTFLVEYDSWGTKAGQSS